MYRFRNNAGLLLGLLFIICTAAPGHSAADRMRLIGTNEGLPSDYVQQLMQDSQGYMWFATRNGLANWDGFSMKVYKSNMRNGDILTSNSIYALAEDSAHRVWIGTTNGLNVIDKRTATVRRLHIPEFENNPISAILATRTGRLLIGSERGLFEYFPTTDSLSLFTRQRTGDVMPQTTVTSLIEDARGHIWIGTWNEGFYRLDPEGRFHAYPHTDSRKSAHVIFEDSRHRI